MEDGAAVFDGLTPPAFHAGEFWVGVCLKTKPPEGERGGETFVDKIDANAHDWIVSVRVTGIPTVEGRGGGRGGGPPPRGVLKKTNPPQKGYERGVGGVGV